MSASVAAAVAESAAGQKPVKKHEVKIKYPDYIGSSFASLLVFVMGASMRGRRISQAQRKCCHYPLLSFSRLALVPVVLLEIPGAGADLGASVECDRVERRPVGLLSPPIPEPVHHHDPGLRGVVPLLLRNRGILAREATNDKF